MFKAAQQHQINHKAILCFAVVAALLLHAWAIIMLQGIQIDFKSPNKAFIEHHMKPMQTAQSDAEKKEGSQKRNEQLAAAFLMMEADKKPEETLKYDFTQNKDEFIEQTFDISQALAHERLQEMQIESEMEKQLADDFGADQIPQVNLPRESSFLRENSAEKILPTHEAQVAETLVKATDLMQGDIIPEKPETAAAPKGIKAGVSEFAVLKGTAFQNQQAVLEVNNQSPSENDSKQMMYTYLGSFRTDKLKEIAPQTDISKIAPKPAPLKGLFLPLGKAGGRTIGIQSDKASIASSNDFLLDVQYMSKSDGRGYIFRLELKPKEGAAFRRIAQNFFFLVDRSHSIRPARYEMSKAAVMSALRYMHPEDSFNILVFDDSIVKLAPRNLRATPENISQAYDFLLRQSYGGLFATTDLYSSLDKIVPDAVGENEINAAILLSDGDTFLTPERQRQTIGKWTLANSGKVSLFSVASGKGNNLALLDLLSVFNKGTLNYATVDSRLGETLMQLMYTIQNPIGKDIVATTIVPSPQLRIALYPTTSRLPNLYEHIPYVLYGSINDLKDFHLFLQGKYYDKWLDIKQLVSFKDAKLIPGGRLEKSWAVQLAYNSYEYYLRDGNPEHLARAKRILRDYH